MRNLLFCLAVALICNACSTRFVEVPSEDNLLYAIQKIDGKDQWGVVLKKDTKTFFSMGGYQYGIITTEDIGNPFRYSGFLCQYDSIAYTNVGDSKMFICYKGTDKYYYDRNTNWCADEKPVTDVEYIGSGKGLCFGNEHEYKFYTTDGVYSTSKGPYEDIGIGYYGYAIKEGGKWGFFYGRHDIKAPKESRYTQIVPSQYDEIIEGFDGSKVKSFIFARQGKKWIVYNHLGRVITIDQSIINRAVNWKNKNSKGSFCTFYF